jgi:hypothetical protein
MSVMEDRMLFGRDVVEVLEVLEGSVHAAENGCDIHQEIWGMYAKKWLPAGTG